MGSKLAFCLILFGTSYIKDGVALQCHECKPSLNAHKCEDDTWTTNACTNGADACIWSWNKEGEHTRTCGTKAQQVNCNENAEAGVCACDNEDKCNGKSMTRSTSALLKCYDCGASDCRDEKTCSDGEDACIKNFVGGVTINKGCGLASQSYNCADGETGVCTCSTDLCNAAVKPGATAASALILLLSLAAAALNVFA